MKDYMQFFRDSASRILGDEGHRADFFESFYTRFMGRSPDIARRFADTDMRRQQRMLEESLAHMVDFSITRKASETLRGVAERHNRAQLDIEPALYDVWLDCVVDTVKEFDLEFRDEVELAWRVVLSPGIAYMKFKHDHA